MPAPDFAAFRDHALTAGHDEVLERSWAPGTVLPTHRHSFAGHALVVAGEPWLEADGQTRHLRPGNRFTLARDQAHAERYGTP